MEKVSQLWHSCNTRLLGNTWEEDVQLRLRYQLCNASSGCRVGVHLQDTRINKDSEQSNKETLCKFWLATVCLVFTLIPGETPNQ